MNIPLKEKFKKEFINYLNEIGQSKLMEFAEKFLWESASKTFEQEFKRLWDKLDVPKAAVELDVKKEFSQLLFLNIKIGLNHSVYLKLKNIDNEEDINEEEFITRMDEYCGYSIKEFFKVYDYHFTLSSLNKSVTLQSMTKKIDDLRKRVEFTNTLSMTDSEKEYQKVFKLIDKEMERREKINQRWSVKATCDYFARNELGIGNSTNQQLELDKFYKKYLIYKDNFNKNK